MKTAPGLSVAAIRALAGDLADRLDSTDGGVLPTQPGRLFFPKQTHELSSVNAEAPDGLSGLCGARPPLQQPDDARLGAGLLSLLLRTVETEITRARTLEARLIEAMGADL